jgi:hypothetical protein
MTTIASNSAFEAQVLNRVVAPEKGSWPQEAAQAVLTLALSGEDRQRMNELAEKASAGTLSSDEELQIEGYMHVCRLIDLLKARARTSLSQSAPTK